VLIVVVQFTYKAGLNAVLGMGEGQNAKH